MIGGKFDRSGAFQGWKAFANQQVTWPNALAKSVAFHPVWILRTADKQLTKKRNTSLRALLRGQFGVDNGG